MANATVGLIIIVLSYAITRFVIDRMASLEGPATGAGS